MPNIILIGYMGSGKTSISKKLGEILDREVIELDNIISNKAGISINEIFNKYGEDYFRDMETQVLKESLNKNNTIISTGGGIIVKEENIELLKDSGIVIYLMISPEEVIIRTRKDNTRPLLKDKNIGKIENMIKNREEKYEKASDFKIDTNNKNIDKIIEEILLVIK